MCTAKGRRVTARQTGNEHNFIFFHSVSVNAFIYFFISLRARVQTVGATAIIDVGPINGGMKYHLGDEKKNFLHVFLSYMRTKRAQLKRDRRNKRRMAEKR